MIDQPKIYSAHSLDNKLTERNEKIMIDFFAYNGLETKLRKMRDYFSPNPIGAFSINRPTGNPEQDIFKSYFKGSLDLVGIFELVIPKVRPTEEYAKQYFIETFNEYIPYNSKKYSELLTSKDNQIGLIYNGVGSIGDPITCSRDDPSAEINPKKPTEYYKRNYVATIYLINNKKQGDNKNEKHI